MIVASKEFSDHVLSVRFTILVILMGLVAVLVVSTAASGIRTAIEQSSDVPALFLMLFWVPHPRFSFSFLAVMALMGPLLGIAFGFDAVNQERTQGTLPRLVSQPIYRDDVINGKFVAGISAIGVVLVCVTVIVAGVGFLRIGVTPTLTEILRTVLWLVISLAYVGFWLALSMLLSVVLRRGATSALAAIAVWLTLAIFGPLIVGVIGEVIAPVPDSPTFQEQVRNARITQNVSRVLPVSLYGEATIALLRPDIRTFDPLSSLLLQAPETRAVQGALTLEQSVLLVWPQLTALIALTVLCFMGAYISFMRQEVRA
jgi:ABC-2 type transport system permease protein